MRLCLFTNCHNGCTTEPTIFTTLDSWIEVFGKPEQLDIYCDPNPNPQLYNKYSYLIEDTVGIKPIKTTGLANGWKRAIYTADTDYLFMCEADWKFNKDAISHSLDDITKLMVENDLWFMLFNKHPNNKSLNGSKWQTYFKASGKPYCLSDRFSNNPNIINVDFFKRKIMPKVDWTIKGAGRIEQVLQRRVDIAIYGKYGNLPAIKHLDGRRGGKK